MTACAAKLIGRDRLAAAIWAVLVTMPLHAGGPVIFAIRGPLARSDLPGLYERACKLLEDSAATVERSAAMVESRAAMTIVCDVHNAHVDAVTVDALARLQLAARRHGCSVRLRNAPGGLLELLALVGLRDVVAD
jgi:ABC-type transporter Mla MlaB component